MPSNPDERRRLWVAGIVVALAVIAVMGERSLRPAPRLGDAPSAAPINALQSLEPYLSLDTTQLLQVMTPELSAPVTVVRDPFHSAGTMSRVAVEPVHAPAAPRDTAARQEHLVVSAILISDARRAAVINDVLVNLGGALPGGGHLTGVERDHIVITDAVGARRTITINPGTL